MAAVSSGAITPCLFWFVHLDSNLKPIPGTMFGKPNNSKLDKGMQCREALLTSTQMVVRTGHHRCIENPGHLRYFYRVSNITNKILPNSFFSRIGKPTQMCTDTYRILEFIVQEPN